ncbi:MAG: 3-dehydroquinate synthase [Candidatus Latescibacterota bacterium]|nr:3-dehydroquinate synthase [Candidatus Latescibacterota bacterium]
MERVHLPLDDGRSYNVIVGHGILDRLGAECRNLGMGRRAAIIADAALNQRWLDPVVASLESAGFQVVLVELEGGEAGKTLTAAGDVLGQLIAAEMDRSSWVVALGGGVVGDLAGFVAATYLRGIDFVQVPTTIVAQVDASIGGKTAVDHPQGKNMVGAFHQPRLVLADTDTLRTLPRAERVAGMAEVVKHGIIRDEELFRFLEENLEAVVDMEVDADCLNWLIARNVGIKVSIVSEDEEEAGLRAILNYGHTVGHAIEVATGYKRYRHGEAVILGMMVAGIIGERLDTWSRSERQRQDALLQRLGIPDGIGEVSADLIVERTRTDKKRIAGQLRLILGKKIGEVTIVDGVDETVVQDAVRQLQEQF